MQKVCIVDDERELADTYAAYLGRSYEVRTFNTPQSALAEFDRDYQPDLVITDLKMPGMDGEQFIEAAQEKGVVSPVILMSGHAEKSHALKAIEQGVSRFLEKPFEPAKLRQAIDSIIKSRDAQRRMLELNRELLAQGRMSRELLRRYRERFIRAENLLHDAKIPLDRDPVQVREMLDRLREESELERQLFASQRKAERLLDPSLPL